MKVSPNSFSNCFIIGPPKVTTKDGGRIGLENKFRPRRRTFGVKRVQLEEEDAIALS